MQKLIAIFILGVLLTTSRAYSSDVLYVGDSHSYGCFGEEIDRTVRSIQAASSGKSLRLRSSATCGSGTWSWLAKTPNQTNCGYRSCKADGKCTKVLKGSSKAFYELLEEEKPKLAIVALGSNMMKSNLTYTMPEVVQMISQIKTSGSECVWVGPPQAAEFFIPPVSYDKYVALLQNTVEGAGCRFISSSDKTARENLNDTMGLHYSCKHGTAWGKKVGDELRPVLERTFAEIAKSSEPAGSGSSTR